MAHMVWGSGVRVAEKRVEEWNMLNGHWDTVGGGGLLGKGNVGFSVQGLGHLALGFGVWVP